jgi:hypothetical protein
VVPPPPGPEYVDGETYLYLDSQKEKPFNIVITGDGFTKADYESGYFDEKVDAVMKDFFTIEPNKGYKEYFKVTKLVAISGKSGITTSKGNTKFSSSVSSSIIDVNKETVFNFVKANIPDIDLTKSYVIMVANSDAYGGGCLNEYGYSGRALTAMAVAQPNAGVIHIHESGHGIAKLGDEYTKAMYDQTTMPKQLVDNIVARRDGNIWNYAPNLDFGGDRTKAEWAKYYTIYNDVDYVKGGAEFLLGCWRSSQHSIMENDLPADAAYGYNAICREAIVRRLLWVAGETFDFDKFLARDSNEKPVF